MASCTKHFQKIGRISFEHRQTDKLITVLHAPPGGKVTKLFNRRTLIKEHTM